MATMVPITGPEINYARLRPAGERGPAPQVGERVLYRHHEWAEELHDAEVLMIQDQHTYSDVWGDPRADGNMWQRTPNTAHVQLPTGTAPQALPVGWLEPHPDPWPLVRLAIPGLGLAALDCREARVRSSPGWLRAA